MRKKSISKNKFFFYEKLNYTLNFVLLGLITVLSYTSHIQQNKIVSLEENLLNLQLLLEKLNSTQELLLEDITLKNQSIEVLQSKLEKSIELSSTNPFFHSSVLESQNTIIAPFYVKAIGITAGIFIVFLTLNFFFPSMFAVKSFLPANIEEKTTFILESTDFYKESWLVEISNNKTISKFLIKPSNLSDSNFIDAREFVKNLTTTPSPIPSFSIPKPTESVINHFPTSTTSSITPNISNLNDHLASMTANPVVDHINTALASSNMEAICTGIETVNRLANQI